MTPAAHTPPRRRRITAEVEIQILNPRRVHQPRGAHHLRADVRLGGVLIYDVLASTAGVAWPVRFGGALVVVLDDALRCRAEDALKRAAWQVNRQEVPA